MDRLLFELSVEYEDVAEMHREVRIQYPSSFHNRAIPFVVPRHPVARNDQVATYPVQSVLLTFAPEKTPTSGKRDTSSESERQRRFETDRVVGPEEWARPEYVPL